MTRPAWLLLLALALLASAIAHDRARDQLLIDPVEQEPAATVAPADFPLCVTVKPRPLLRSPQGRVDYRVGEPLNDRGD
jgi:hypothetical protein